MIRRPPLVGRLLSSLLRGPDADILRGDIEESFRRRAGNDNPRTGAWAGLSYLVDVLRSVVAWWNPNAVRRRARARSGIQLAYRRQKAMGIGGSLSDVWYAGRSLVRRPAFTIVAVLTLGLGIGSAVTIYSVVDAVVVRPLPYEGAARLVRVGITFPDQEWDDRYAGLQHLASVSGANFQDWRERARSFAKLAGMCANLSWKLKRLQTLWFDGIGRNNIKPVRDKEPR